MGTSVPYEVEYDPPLDPGIADVVIRLNAFGVETYASCQGGPGHAYPEPTVRFFGDRSEGFRALAVALQHNFPVRALRRIWRVIDGEPTGPDWELTFYERIIYPLRSGPHTLCIGVSRPCPIDDSRPRCCCPNCSSCCCDAQVV